MNLSNELILQLLEICERTYDAAEIVAGPDGRDGASLTPLPDGTLVVCFRGTLVNDDLTSALDWFNDLHADLVEADGFPGRVHAGFLDSINALWPAVFDAIEQPDVTLRPKPAPLPPRPANPLSLAWWKKIFGVDDASNVFLPMPEVAPLPWNRRVVITGHSKGFPLALLAGARLAALKPTVIGIAGPMCGDAEFAANYPDELEVINYVGDYDLVPRLPPYLFGYHPVGKIIRQGVIPPELCDAAINRLIAGRQWGRIREAHGISTGYRPWIAGEPTPPAKEEREAA